MADGASENASSLHVALLRPDLSFKPFAFYCEIEENMVGARVYFRGFFKIISSEFTHKNVLDFNTLFLVGLWGLVNNAGIAYVMPVEWTPMSIFKRTADVTVKPGQAFPSLIN